MSGNDAQDPYDEEYLVAEGEQLMVSIASWIDSSFFCVCFLFGPPQVSHSCTESNTELMNETLAGCP